MKVIKKPSAIPIYGIAATWVLWCLLFPMYRTWHFLLCAALSAAVFFLLRKKFPGTEEQVETPVSTGNEEIDTLLADGKTAVAELDYLSSRIEKPEIAAKVKQLRELTQQIYDDVRKDPTDFKPARRFLDYYRPTTAKLLTRYTELQADNAPENMLAAKTSIEEMLDGIVTAYRKELNSLYENDLVDITADIQVMEKKMAAEGLTEQKEF